MSKPGCFSLPEQVFLSQQRTNIFQSLFRKAKVPHLLQPRSQCSTVHHSQTVLVQERQQRPQCIQNGAVNVSLIQRRAL